MIREALSPTLAISRSMIDTAFRYGGINLPDYLLLSNNTTCQGENLQHVPIPELVGGKAKDS